MWIFCCGMQRSGSTLQFQLAARLVEDAGLGKRVDWVRPEQFPELRTRHADDAGWKVFKNHVCTDAMTSEFRRGSAVGIYVFRDLRDVFVSAAMKYSLTFERLWASGFLEECLANYRRWTSLPRMLVSSYETMVGDLPEEVARIAAHLGLPRDRQRDERIASDYAVTRQLERIREASEQGTLRRGFANARFDPYTMLHTNHIASGEVNGWRHVLTPTQVALIEARARDWLVDHGYELTLGPFRRTLLRLGYSHSRMRRRVVALARSLAP